jgi:hypothetical protein
MKKMEKKSYLNMSSPDGEKRYDLEVWYNCEQKVAMYMNDGYSFDDSVKVAAKTNMTSEEEKYDFYNWIKNRFNYKKASLDKEAVHYFSPIADQSDWRKDDLSEKTYEAKEKFNHSKDSGDATYKKLRRYLLGLTRLLLENENISTEDYEEAHKYIGMLTKVFRSSMSKSAKSNYAFNIANKMLKLSNNQVGGGLRKFAQEVAEDAGVVTDSSLPDAPTATAAPPRPISPGQTEDPMADGVARTEPVGPQDEALGESKDEAPVESKPTDGIPSSDEVKPIRFEDIKVPDHDDRYDDLAGDINVGDAANKLDEIAGMLADRRVIRLLAEFDIMLDRLGIASMFPELAESQSKLIDSFSYALTRVTKMMGQLANAQQAISSTEKVVVPGSDVEG